MDLLSMDGSKLEATLRQAMTYPEARAKLIPIRNKRNALLAPEFEKTSAGIFAKNEREAALKDPEIIKMQASLKQAEDRLALAKNPAPIKRRKDRQTILIATIFIIVAVVTFIASRVLNFQTDTTPQRTITMVYTVSAFFAVAYVVYRYFFWKRYSVALIKYAQGKLDELDPIRGKLAQIRAEVDEHYAEQIQPFSETYQSNDPAYLDAQQAFLDQQAITAQARAAYKAIPAKLRDKHIIQRFIQSLHQNPDTDWQTLSSNYLDELDREQAAREQARQQAKQRALDAKNNTARNRNLRHVQQHYEK